MCGDLIYCPGILLIMADRVTTVVSIKGYEIIFLIVIFEDLWSKGYLANTNWRLSATDKYCVAFSLATRIDFIAHLQAKVS